MYVRPARQTVAGASVGPDAGRSAGDHGHPEQFREPARGFPWAWDEEVVAGAAHLPARQIARLAVASPVAADAIAEAVLRRGVPQAAGPERESSDALGAKVVEAQDAVRPSPLELLAQRAVLPQVPLALSPQPVLAQRVSPRELLAQELWLARAPHAKALRARVSQPRAPEHVVLPEPPLVLGPPASPPQVDGPTQAKQQQEPLQEEQAFAKLPSPLLLSPSVRLPPRFRRPLHPAGDA
jgi:hypothetical protein